MTLSALLQANGNDLTNQDLAALADWAVQKQRESKNPEWKRAYALVREGADTVLRRRASEVVIAAMQTPAESNGQAVHGQPAPISMVTPVKLPVQEGITIRDHR